MLKFFWKESEALATRQVWRWQCDPLSHPALDTMTQRELGDLPFATPPQACHASLAPVAPAIMETGRPYS